MAGISVGNKAPFTQVVRLNERYHLFNGYHRAYSLRLAGVTHMPCLVRENAQTLIDAGIKNDGSTLRPEILNNNHIPTVAHFTQGRAAHVKLRDKSVIITVNWEEHLIYE
jgi:hypothetical protein